MYPRLPLSPSYVDPLDPLGKASHLLCEFNKIPEKWNFGAFSFFHEKAQKTILKKKSFFHKHFVSSFKKQNVYVFLTKGQRHFVKKTSIFGFFGQKA